MNTAGQTMRRGKGPYFPEWQYRYINGDLCRYVEMGDKGEVWAPVDDKERDAFEANK